MSGEKPNKNTLYEKIKDILKRDWNPLSVPESLETEYEAYIPEVLELKKSGATAEAIASALHRIEREKMGCPGSMKNCQRAADKIMDLPDFFA